MADKSTHKLVGAVFDLSHSNQRVHLLDIQAVKLLEVLLDFGLGHLGVRLESQNVLVDLFVDSVQSHRDVSEFVGRRDLLRQTRSGALVN